MTNAEIRIQVTADIYRRVTERKVIFFGHVCRMNSKRQTKTVVYVVRESPKNQEDIERDGTMSYKNGVTWISMVPTEKRKTESCDQQLQTTAGFSQWRTRTRTNSTITTIGIQWMVTYRILQRFVHEIFSPAKTNCTISSTSVQPKYNVPIHVPTESAPKTYWKSIHRLQAVSQVADRLRNLKQCNAKSSNKVCIYGFSFWCGQCKKIPVTGLRIHFHSFTQCHPESLQVYFSIYYVRLHHFDLSAKFFFHLRKFIWFATSFSSWWSHIYFPINIIIIQHLKRQLNIFCCGTVIMFYIRSHFLRSQYQNLSVNFTHNQSHLRMMQFHVHFCQIKKFVE